mgnify:FL=1
MDITLYRNQLKLDADLETRKASLFQVAKDHPEEQNEAQMGLEEGDKRYFERRCQEGIDDLLALMHRFVTGCQGEKVLEGNGDNRLEDTKQWVITLKFDSRRNIVARSLANACHQFVLLTVLHSWAVATMPDLAGQYADRRKAAGLLIQKIIYHKEPPTLEE